jgi:shikimate dehydrogenase
VVVGAGGAARSIVAALLDAGVPRVRLVNRTADRAERLASDLGAAGPGEIEILAWTDRDQCLADAGLLINATSLGMAGNPGLTLSLDLLPEAAAVVDIVYNPLETALLAAARARGNPVVDGLGMLLHQARPAFAAWFGIDPEVTEAQRMFVMAGLTGADR